MPPLTLYGRPIKTVFDLLGNLLEKKENVLTYTLGWELANSLQMTKSLLSDVASELSIEDVGENPIIRLEQHIPDSGFTDVEIRTQKMHVIIEAKRGWGLPSKEQLCRYAPSLTPGLAGALLIVAEGHQKFATGKFASSVPGPGGAPVPVIYRSWEQVSRLGTPPDPSTAETPSSQELPGPLKKLVNTQRQRDNMVYVVPLGLRAPDWSPISGQEIVFDHHSYFHPIGNLWPAEPPNYLAFRFNGRLQRICHVDAVEITSRPRDFIPLFTAEHDFPEPHYFYRLGTPIEPGHEVRCGKPLRAMRHWIALDLLLTCRTISQARERTLERLDATETTHGQDIGMQAHVGDSANAGIPVRPRRDPHRPTRGTGTPHRPSDSLQLLFGAPSSITRR